MKMEEFYLNNSNSNTIMFVCCNGETLNVNKDALSRKTYVFHQQEINQCCIVNFDKLAFQTFLNVLMQYEELTSSKALKIFPIAHKFNILQILNACVSVLKPSGMSETVVLTLNLAAEFICDDLINSSLCVIASYGIDKLLQEEKLYVLIEPKAMLYLVRNIDMNFIILMGIKNWGNYYLKKNNIDSTLCSFLEKNRISSVLSLDKLSNTDLVLSLYDKDVNKNLFPSSIYVNHLQNISSCITNSSWENMSSQIIGEHFTTRFPIYITTSVLFKVHLNPIIINEDDVTVEKNLLKYLTPDLTVHGFIVSQSAFGQKSSSNENAIFSNLSFSLKQSTAYFIFKPLCSFYIESVTLNYRFMNDKCKILKMNFSKSQGIFNKCESGPHFTQDIVITKRQDMLKHK